MTQDPKIDTSSTQFGYRMSRALREELEVVAVKCSNMDPHQAADHLERLLGGTIDDDRQEVVYPLGHPCWKQPEDE